MERDDELDIADIIARRRLKDDLELGDGPMCAQVIDGKLYQWPEGEPEKKRRVL